MRNNTFTNCTSMASTGPSHMIYNRGALTNTFNAISITNNVVSNCINTSTSSGQFYSIWNNGVTSTISAINNNSITNVTWNTLSGLRHIISNAGASASAIAITNNLLANCVSTLNTTGIIFGINNTASSNGALAISNNTFSNLFTTASTGDTYLIHNSGAQTNSITLSDNLIANCTNSAGTSGTFYQIYNNAAGSAGLEMSRNTLTFSNSRGVTGSTYFIYNRGAATNSFVSMALKNNLITSCSGSISSTGSFNGIVNSGVSGTLLSITSNTISNVQLSSTTGAINLLYNTAALSNSISMSGNLLSAFTNTGTSTGTFFGIVNSGSSTGGDLSIVSNTVLNLSSAASTGNRYLLFNNGGITNSISISNNVISSCNHSITGNASFFVIHNNGASSAQSCDLSSNILQTIFSSATSGATNLIYNLGLVSNTIGVVTMTNNLVTNLTNSISAGGAFNGLFNAGYSSNQLNLTTNTFSNVVCTSTSSPRQLLANSGKITGSLSINSNLISNYTSSLNTSGVFYGIYNNGITNGDLSMTSNTLSNLVLSSSNANIHFIFNSGVVTNTLNTALFNSNVFSSFSGRISAGGIFYGLYNSAFTSGILNMNANTVTQGDLPSISSNRFMLYNTGPVLTQLTANNNSISAISSTSNTTGNFYGIINSGNSLGDLNCSNNTINTLSLVASTGSLFGITNTGTVSNLCNISQNIITAITHSASSSGGFLGLYNSPASGISLSSSLTINTNTLTNISLVSTSGASNFIYNRGAITNTINFISFNNNLISSTTHSSVSGAFFAIFNSAISSGVQTMNSNSCSGIKASTGTGNRHMLYNTGALLSALQFTNNVMSDFTSTLNTSGMFYDIYNAGNSNGDILIYSNSISGHSLSASSGSAYAVYNTGVATNTTVLSNNLISNINHSATAAGGYLGIYNSPALGTSSSASLDISSNTFTIINLQSLSGGANFIYNRGLATNTINITGINNNLITACNHSSTSGPFYAIYNNAITHGSLSVNNNTCTNLIATSATANRNFIYNTGNLLSTLQISNNQMSNFASSFNTTGNFYAVYNAGNSAGDILINANTITNQSLTASTGSFFAICNTGIATNTTSLLSNLISGISYSANGNGGFLGVYHSPGLATSNSASLSINTNTLNTIFANASTGGFYFIHCRGAATNTISNLTINSNVMVSSNYSTSTGVFYSVFNSGISTGSMTVLSNTCNQVVCTTTNSNRYMIYNTGPIINGLAISGNQLSNFTSTLNTAGHFYGINNGGNSSGDLLISNNQLQNNALSANTGSVFGVLNTGTVSNNMSVSNNLISDLSFTATNVGGFVGIYHNPLPGASNSAGLDISTNTFSNTSLYLSSGGTNFLATRGATANLITSVSCSNNLIVNVTHSVNSGPFYGFFNTGMTSGSLAVNSNSFMTIVSTTSTSPRYFFNNAGPANNAISIASNLVSNYTSTLNTTGLFYDIINTGSSAGKLDITSNMFSNQNMSSTTGSVAVIYNTGVATNSISIIGNTASTIIHQTPNAYFYGVYNGAASSNISITNNSLTNVVSSTSTIPKYFFYNSANAGNVIQLNGNSLSNYSNTVNTTGSFYGAYNIGNSGGDLSLNANTIAGISFASTTGSTFPVCNRGTVGNAASISANLVSNFSNSISTSGLFYGINNIASNSNLLSMTGNSLTSLALSTLSLSTYLVLNAAASAVTINTININTNSVSNYTLINSAGNFYGIYNNNINANKTSLSGNSFSAGVLTATSSNIYMVYNSGAVNNTLDLNTNLISGLSNSLHVNGLFYGVYNSAGCGDLNMNANTVNSAFLENTINDTYLIYNSAAVTNDVAMNTNLIANCTNSTLSSGNYYGVFNNGASATLLSMNNNTLTNNYSSGTAGNTYLVSNAASISNSITMSANKLGYNFTNTLTNHYGDINAIVNTGTNALVTISITANDFANFSFSGQNGIGNLYFIQNLNDNVNLDISNNTWTNLNLKHNANEYLICNPSQCAGLLSVNTNSIITGFNRSGLAGSLFIYTSGTIAAATNTQVFSGNNFSNINATTPGTGSFYGIYSNDGGLTPFPKKTISNNIISNVTYAGLGFMYPYYADYLGDANSGSGSSINTNTLSNITWGGPVYGISTGTNASALYATNIFSNTISVVSSSANVSGSYGAFLNGAGAGLNFYKNKLNDLTETGASASMDGVHIESGSLVSISNNVIGNLYAPNTVSLNAVNGLNVVGAATVNAFYNTIYLKATSAGSVFSSNALISGTNTALNLRNNIFINLSTANANGVTTAYRRNGVSLGSYSLSSNNNLFYAGIPALNRAVYADGTNLYQTLTNFQTAVSPRENLSFSENTPFTSTLGINSNFLHVNPIIPSLTESKAINILGISNDIDNQIRQGNAGYIGTGLAPDCGADEYDQNLTPCSSANAGTVSIPISNVRCAGEDVFMLSTGSTAAGNLVHQWKFSASSGGPYSNVNGGVGTNYTAYTSGSLSAGTFYYVMVTTCTLGNIVSVSNEVTVTVNPVPTATAAIQSTSICSGQILNLLGGSNIGTTYLWKGPNSFSSTVQNPSVNNAVSNASGIYTLMVSDINCTSTPVTVNATVHPSPPAFTLSPTSSSMCVGAVKTISASISLTTPTLNFGSQSFQNSATGFPAPYSGYYGGQKMQMMILAGELLAAGFTVGTPINSLQFPVVSKGVNWGTSITACQNFQVNVKLTSANALLAFQSGLSNVVTASNYTPSIGYGNMHTFSAPFIWDGSSNLIIETVFSNNTIGSAGSAVVQYHSPTGFQSTLVYRADNQTIATLAAASASNVNVGFVRPDFKLNGIAVGTYSWGPSAGLLSTSGQSVNASPTITTVYTASLNDGQCASSASMQLNVILIPTVTIVSTSTMVCFGNSATLTANGAQTYTWSTSSTGTNIIVSPFTSTTYSVTGSNPACPNSMASYSILALPALTLNVNSTPPALCVGSSATLNASGATSYSWNGSANGSSLVVSPTITTNYSILGSNGTGCQATKVLLMKVNPLPIISVTPLTATVCPEAEVSFDANGALTYTWLPGNSNLSTLLVTPKVSGVYIVKGTDLNTCRNSATVIVVIDNCTGLSRFSSESSTLKIYPNPSTGLVTLSFNEIGLKTILVINSMGSKVIELSSRETTEFIDLTAFAKGVYMVKISGSINKTAKLIIE